MVRLGKAVNESTTKAEADTIAEVIISQASQVRPCLAYAVSRAADILAFCLLVTWCDRHLSANINLQEVMAQTSVAL